MSDTAHDSPRQNFCGSQLHKRVLDGLLSLWRTMDICLANSAAASEGAGTAA